MNTNEIPTVAAAKAELERAFSELEACELHLEYLYESGADEGDIERGVDFTIFAGDFVEYCQAMLDEAETVATEQAADLHTMFGPQG